jgi:hypothetical protein
MRRIATLGLLLSVLAVGCGKAAPDPWLTALRQERLATFVPLGGKLVLNFAEGEHEDFYGNQVDAQISRVFAYRSAVRAVRARGAAVRAAVADGWHVKLVRRYPDEPFFGSKRLSPGASTLTIGTIVRAHRFEVTVRLEEGACGQQCNAE